MLQSPLLTDSLAALARDSARARLLEGGTDLRYFPEAWFFLGLAVSIFAWCWRTWKDVHGAAPGIPDALGAAPRPDYPPGDPLHCPACDGVVGDTRAPLGYLTVCPGCGRPISVLVVDGARRVVVREG